MPLFVCDECNCVENTALGLYWSVGIAEFKDKSKNNKALCSACKPKEYIDGSMDNNAGVWHGKFSRVAWDGKEKVINR